MSTPVAMSADRKQVTVRLAELEDAPELARLRWDYREDERARQSRAEFLIGCQAWLQEAIESGRWQIAVASSTDSRLCGCIYLERVDKVPVPGAIRRAWGYITNSYVEAGQRGGGLGRQLLDLLIEVARDHGLEFLIVWPSEEAVSFYQRAGFQLAQTLHDRDDDYPPLELEL